MALGTIAPWLQLPDFQRSAEAGARIGQQQRAAADEIALGRERNAQAAAEAAGRLGLGYAELGASRDKAKADQELAKAMMTLRQGRYSDLSQLEQDRLGLGRERLGALQDNRDVVNGLHQDQLDSLNDHRDAVDALRGVRTTGGTRPGTGGASAEKPFMVKVPIPANPETGEAATTVSLPSTHPAAQAYLKAHGLSGVPSETDTGVYQSPVDSQAGETLPLPDGTAQAAQALQPRNQIYEGSQTENPIFEPGPMPPETLPRPAAKSLDKDTASTFLKQAGGDKEAARRLAREAGYQF